MVCKWWDLENLLRVALSACDARCTTVQLRFSANIAAARDGLLGPNKKTAIAGGFVCSVWSLVREPAATPPPEGWNG